MRYDDWSDSDLVEEVCEIESGLSDWEVKFIEDVTKQVEDQQELTWRQRSKLAQIISQRSV